VTAREFSIQVIRRLHESGFQAYWAGGCVRDMLLGKPAKDFDVATNAQPQQVREIFGERHTLAVGESFGVIIVLGPKSAGPVEVATFRKDAEYHDGRRPSAVSFCDAAEDAQRRDFTINGMFYDPMTSTVHDFVGGQVDLARRVVRAIGDPHARMAEDKLRMLRAVRFTATLQFELDPVTTAAVREMHSQIILVSAQELRRMLAPATRATAATLLREVDLLPVILPEVPRAIQQHGEEVWQVMLQVLDRLHVTTFEPALATLLRFTPSPEWQRRTPPEMGTVADVSRRLKLSNEESEHIVWLVQQQGRLAQAPKLPLWQLKRLCVHPHFTHLLEVERRWGEVTGQETSPYDWVDKYLAKTPQERLNPPELLTGRDLIALGHQPGPLFREWLDTIRNAQLNEDIETAAAALTLLQQLQSERK
jgi:poly(A) polymerase